MTGAKRGFTLIELLVVISIIMLLIAVLLPALRRARESATAMACLSNLRQVAIGAVAYADDHQGLWAHDWSDVEWNTNLLGNYLAGRVVFLCPNTEDTSDLLIDEWRWTTYGCRTGYAISSDEQKRVYNMLALEDVGWVQPARQDVYDVPSRYWMFFDSAGGWSTWRPMTSTRTGSSSPIFSSYSENTGGAALRHGEVMNTAFVDGHAEAIIQKDVYTLVGFQWIWSDRDNRQVPGF